MNFFLIINRTEFLDYHPFWLEKAKECKVHIFLIREALKKYIKDHNGEFPNTLEELFPDYIKDPYILHCPIDFNTNRLVSYLYTKPHKTDPENKIILSCERHYIYNEKVRGWYGKWGCDVILFKNLDYKIRFKEIIPNEELIEKTRRAIKERYEFKK